MEERLRFLDLLVFTPISGVMSDTIKDGPSESNASSPLVSFRPLSFDSAFLALNRALPK
jgi:hypothetical protein